MSWNYMLRSSYELYDVMNYKSERILKKSCYALVDVLTRHMPGGKPLRPQQGLPESNQAPPEYKSTALLLTLPALYQSTVH
jgi:hypothetical protein